MAFATRKLSTNLLLMMLVPAIVLIYFAASQAINAYSLKQSFSKIQELTSLSVIVGQLVHEVQKERGMTAIFISSAGSEYASELRNQRSETNQRIKAFETVLERMDSEKFGETLKQNVLSAERTLNKVSKVRNLIDQSMMSLNDALTYYTKINTQGLSLIPEIAKLSPDHRLAIMVLSYANFLQVKEFSGIERAVLGAVFSQDSFGVLYDKYLGLVSKQSAYLDVFLSTANQDTKALYSELVKGPFIVKTQALRDLAMSKVSEGKFGVDPGEWFTLQTGKIDLYKQVEDGLSEQLHELAGNLKESALTHLYFALLIAFLGVIASVLTGLLLAGRIRKQLGGEPHEIQHIAEEIAAGSFYQTSNASKKLTGVFASMRVMQSRLKQVIEGDIQQVVDQAKMGDLSGRIKLDDKQGFYHELSNSINQLVTVSDNVISDTFQVFSAMDRGDLSQLITREYEGTFKQLKQNANASVTKLKKVIEQDIQEMVLASRSGNLNERISLEDKEGFYFLLSQSINELVEVSDQVIQETSLVIAAMTEGDLSKQVEQKYQGQFGKLVEDTNLMVDQLTHIIGQIQTAAIRVSTGADEIAKGNFDLSKRTELQAATLEETSANTEHMTHSVKQSSQYANDAKEAANLASIKANEGGEVVANAVVAMDSIGI